MKFYPILLFIISIFIFSCTVEPKPINYGNDHCHFCDMTVVDKTHAAQYTTKKGKCYSFDAIECLINELNQEKNEEKMAFILVADYNNPSELIDAKSATFLISEQIKSPMGANLSAFASEEIAKKYQADFGGSIYNWTDIKLNIKK